MASRILFHGSNMKVEFPEVRKAKFNKDFSWGFYCTNDFEQASRWATRRKQVGVINKYIYTANPNLKILKFDEMTDEWLDFIAKCRSGAIHEFDIVEGPMADDTIWNFVNDFLRGDISRELFWQLAKFKHPTHQISFHTLQALDCLVYEGSEYIDSREIEK